MADEGTGKSQKRRLVRSLQSIGHAYQRLTHAEGHLELAEALDQLHAALNSAAADSRVLADMHRAADQ